MAYLKTYSGTTAYFFFFGFFFLTPLAVVAPAAAEANNAAVSAADVAPSCVGVATAGVCCAGWRFCIFCIRDRLRASKRLRNIDE